MDMKKKFRGQKIGTSEWVFGSLIVDYANNCFIFEDDRILDFRQYNLCDFFVPVIPETVGQFTGMSDSHQYEIYEGDILVDMKGERLTIDGMMRFYLSIYIEQKLPFEFTIIGNIHDGT